MLAQCHCTHSPGRTMLRAVVLASLALAAAATPLDANGSAARRALQAKTCHAVPAAQCGTKMGENTCLKCAAGATYDCEQCCPGLKRTTVGGYSFCEPGKGPAPTPPPSPPPSPPHSRCAVTLEELCGRAQKQGATVCDNCLKTHWLQLQRAGCSFKTTEAFCEGGGPPPPSPGGKYECYQDQCYEGKGTLSKAACDESCGSPSPPPGGTYECYQDQCYEGKGTLSKAACDESCGSPSPPPGPGGGYTCYQGTCYEKAGGTLSKAECDTTCAPGPPPGPPPGGDSWETYTVAGMQVQSVVGGKNSSDYEKVIIMLHGGGETGSMWPGFYSQGWFGDLTGLKYVFPTSPDHLWYQSYKTPGCGLLNDCAYNLSSITYKASLVRALLDQEMRAVGNNGKNVYLAGFSEGAQMTGYMQLVNLPFALGGVVVMDGFPLPPLENMPGASQAAARANASYYADDMKWVIYEGSADPIFPEKLTLDTWNGIFTALGCSTTMKTQSIPGMTHTLVEQEFTALVALVRNGTLPSDA